MMKKLTGLIAAIMLFAGFWMPNPASAQTFTIPQSTITQLQQQIQDLINQLTTFRQTLLALQPTTPPTTTTGIRLSGALSEGMTGTDVTTLQQILATDPTIYPEGLVTGFYGPLTSAAVARFQQRFGVSGETGAGANTVARINQILQQGVGTGTTIPSGLLTTPSIVSQFGVPQPAPTPTTPTDTTAPTISVLSPSFLPGGTQARLFWGTNENATSRVFLSTTPITSESLGQEITPSGGMVSSNNAELTGLAPNTTYYYVIVSRDQFGNVATSSQQTFTTPAQ